jgi:protein involved in polysaccharide export with SLBB domain
MTVKAMIYALLLALVAVVPTGSRAQPDSGASDSTYRLAADDKIKIAVYGETPLTGEYLVGSDGRISFPLVGMVEAGGLTLAELQRKLTERLNDTYLNDAKVTVDVVEYRPFYILGEVNKAGQYPYKVGLTVRAAVATAGGFTYRANTKKIAIQHRGETTEQKTALTADLQVRPGDTIRVLERFF